MSMTNTLLKMTFALVLLPILASAQTTKQDTLWQPIAYFAGQWQGEGGGQAGAGFYERSYQFIFYKHFMEVKNKSTYPPSEQNPKGEVHEDRGFFSYDKIRQTFVLRQFHIEGFVNQYKLESMSPDGKKMVFVSEAIENIPAGWRARETYEITGADEFTETFELAPPEKEFEVYSQVTLKRVQ